VVRDGPPRSPLPPSASLATDHSGRATPSLLAGRCAPRSLARGLPAVGHAPLGRRSGLKWMCPRASTKRAFGCVSLAPGGRSVDGRETGLSAGRSRRAGRRAGLDGQECVGRAAAPRGHAGAAAAPSEATMSEQSASTRDVSTPERRTYCTADVTCSRCGGLLYPNRRADAWECRACKLTRPRSSRDRFVTTLCQIEQSPTILEGGIDRGLPTSSERCPDCGHDQAYWDLKQLRAADESATLLFICTACEHTWRDAD